MSTAFFPTNMRHMPASGVNHRSTFQNLPYRSWKGRGLFANPVGMTATHIRPLTNRDYGNYFPTGFGLPRPLKHYRKGTVVVPPVEHETDLLQYNLNRAVGSSNGSSLHGGYGLVGQLMETPGGSSVKNNTMPTPAHARDSLEGAGTGSLANECATCHGIGFVSDWYPINNLTEKPQVNVTQPPLCCNEQRKALERVRPANTNLPKTYFQTTHMYLYNRCQTFDQRSFNFLVGVEDPALAALLSAHPAVTAATLLLVKPGDPLSLLQYYVAQCNPNFVIQQGAVASLLDHVGMQMMRLGWITAEQQQQTTSMSLSDAFQHYKEWLSADEFAQLVHALYTATDAARNGWGVGQEARGCARVYYKPNNPQFAVQGGVSSSTRILKLNVDTLNSAAASRRNVFKSKTPPCQASTYSGNPFFFQGQHQNKLICQSHTNGAEYRTYVSRHQHAAGNYIGATQP